MTRKTFIKMCGILGVGLPLQSSLTACNDEDIDDKTFSGKILIIGAGAGGLSAGYLLKQQGVDFEIIEASSNYGGRMSINTDFADFPIPLGAEWLHADTDEFSKIVNDSTVPVILNTVGYDNRKDTYGIWKNGQLKVGQLKDSDIKFVNYSWFNFYDDYIVPSISEHIVYDTIVHSINYTDNQIVVGTQNGQLLADKVIVCIPLKMLQLKTIEFIPALPQNKLDAIQNTVVWDGFKAFIEFSEKFYDTQISFKITPSSDGQKLYYDAAYGQNTTKHILGLFVVGKPVQDYIHLSDDELKDFMLKELDQIYPNQASGNYIKHLSQNWNNVSFIKGGYVSDEADWRMIEELGKSVGDKIYFAGGAYTNGEDWVSVHAAAQSAKDVVQALL